MDRKIKGFSLIELLVVVVIMIIILSIGIPGFLKWIVKYRIESDTTTIYSFLQDQRVKAFAEKINLNIDVLDNEICSKCDTNDSTCKSLYSTGNIKCEYLNYKFKANKKISISERGTFSRGTIYYPSKNDAKYDCVKVGNINIRMEKCNGTP